MESTINFWAMISLVVMTILLVETFHIIVNKIVLYLNPVKPYAWAEPYARRKIKFQHPKYKGVEADGLIAGIKFTNEKAKGGGYKMKLEIDEGAAGITPIWLDSKWEYVDVKNKP